MYMKLTKPYKYPSLVQLTQADGNRTYDPGHGRPLPSVTTILSNTGDKSFLAEWRKNVGNAEADRIVAEAVQIGNQLHDNLEHYILTGRKPEGRMLERILTDLVIKRGLSKVDEVWGTETQLYLPGLYAGTSDLVGVWKGKPAIMDFKNSRKWKRREWIDDYFLQLVAYALAHNELFGTDIRCGVIMMAVRDGNYLEFTIEGEEFDQYAIKWAERVALYYEMFPVK